MPRLIFVSSDGEKREVDARLDTTVMSVAKSSGVPSIIGDCGGSLSCASCHVLVEEPWSSQLAPPGEDEDEMLDEVAAERDERSRLSCQILVTEELDGMVMHVPELQ